MPPTLSVWTPSGALMLKLPVTVVDSLLLSDPADSPAPGWTTGHPRTRSHRHPRLGRQVGDGHIVIVIADTQRQRRRAGVTITIRQHIGEHLAPRRPARQRHKLRVSRVEGIGVAAVSTQHQTAIGPVRVPAVTAAPSAPCTSLPSTLPPSTKLASLATPGLLSLLAVGTSIHYPHTQGVVGTVAIAVHQGDREILKQVVVASPARVHLVVRQRVAVAHQPRRPGCTPVMVRVLPNPVVTLLRHASPPHRH
ncbi:Uncharacterised protein [Aeromonas salmonicida]|nr:Uncharacterised protein [Aeromonas salmonicida]